MTLIQQPLCRTPRLLLRHQKRGSSQLVQCWLRSYSSGRIGGGGSDGDGMKIYNSLSSSNRTLPTHHHPPRACTTSPSKNNDKRKEQPRRGTAWYVCGPTVYDSAHLGHGRTYVSLDILRRVALHNHSQNNNPQRPRPMYVMNITDVDDKIIKRSMENINSNSSRDNDGNGTKSEKGKEADPLSLARHYEREFWQDMDALNVMRPDVVCRVSEHVEMTIVPYIQQIVDGGMAYVIPEEQQCTDGIESKRDESGATQQQTQGSVYFDVRAFEAITNGRTKYGKLAPDAASSDFFSWDESNNNNNNDDDEGEPLRTKRDPRDFCLWKYRSRSTKTTKPTTVIVEPSSVSYSSPWGPGRPGWHVECSAMIQRLADDFRSTHEFDVHCGGVDLKFPHHSNEIAQAEAHSVACDIGSSSGNNSDDGNDSNGSSTGREEWISHWIHTGHLYVKGRKMSKSLKNFVTIREMLGVAPKTHSVRTASIDDAIASSAIDQDNNAWSSPSDDFRLWVLGLSGSYRGPSTFSKDRMEEARVIREKWVRFLMEGQECLDRWNTTILDDDMYDGGGDRSSRLWGDEEIELFRTVTQCSMNCERALLDDLDGTSFVKELNCIAEAGQTYVQWATANQNKKQRTVNPPEEPLRFVLDTFRGQLNLVGFTQRTANVGISARLSSSSLDQQELGTSLAPSTNTAILDEAVAFRKAVRTAALGAVRKKMDSSDAVKDILKLCDEMRDGTFPKLGVEILDGKVAVETAKDAEGNTSRGWRHCSPRGRA